MKKPLRIYIAAAWSRREEMANVAENLKAAIPGIEITSRWLQEPIGGLRMHEPELPSSFRQRRALEDLTDVRRADVLIRFTDDLSGETVPARLATGSRMFEMGIAYERAMKIIVVNGFQPIFDHLPSITHVQNVTELKNYLKDFLVMSQRRTRKGELSWAQ